MLRRWQKGLWRGQGRSRPGIPRQRGEQEGAALRRAGESTQFLQKNKISSFDSNSNIIFPEHPFHRRLPRAHPQAGQVHREAILLPQVIEHRAKQGVAVE